MDQRLPFVPNLKLTGGSVTAQVQHCTELAGPRGDMSDVDLCHMYSHVSGVASSKPESLSCSVESPCLSPSKTRVFLHSHGGTMHEMPSVAEAVHTLLIFGLSPLLMMLLLSLSLSLLLRPQEQLTCGCKCISPQELQLQPQPSKSTIHTSH